MKERLYVAAVLGGLGVLIALAVVVFRFGRFDPSPPSLAKHPNAAIPGEIVYVDRHQCIRRAAASGAWNEEVYCIGNAPGPVPNGLVRIDANTVGYYVWTAPSQLKLTTIDLRTHKATATGKTITGEKTNLPPLSPAGDTIQVDGDGRVFVVTNGVRTQVADFEAPDYGAPQPLGWSPDSQWLVLTYFARRSDGGNEIWILSRDGRTQGTLATDAQTPAISWWIDGTGSWPSLE